MPGDPLVVECLAEAAAGGHRGAETELGLCYNTGYGVNKDDEAAVRWLEKSARHGDPDGQYHLGLMLLEGINGALEQDCPAGVKFLEKGE